MSVRLGINEMKRTDVNMLFDRSGLVSFIEEKGRWEKRTVAKTLEKFPERLKEFERTR
jgi:hypothetical protein